MDKKGFWLIVGVLILGVILCLLLFIFGDRLLADLGVIPQKVMGSVVTPVDSVVETPLIATEAVIFPDPTASPTTFVPLEIPLDPEIEAKLQQIERDVESFRELPQVYVLDRFTISREDLKKQLNIEYEMTYDEDLIFREMLVYILLGVLDPEYDLGDTYAEFYGEQIGGFYDSKENKMVFVGNGEFGGLERVTYAHEYTHALQDQLYALDIGLGLNAKNCEENREYCSALRGLIEGDATLTEQIWFLQYATDKDVEDIYSYYDTVETDEFASSPAALQEDFLFPYRQGLNFVYYLFFTGGYRAIDLAFYNPPETTEQILHPYLYPQEKPIVITLPTLIPVLGDGWEQITTYTLGEWYYYLLLKTPYHQEWAIEETQAAEAAAGWGGDKFAVYYNEQIDQSVLVNLSQWDTLAEADEFWDSFSQYANARWSAPIVNQPAMWVWSVDGQAVLLMKKNDKILWVIAPDLTVMEQIQNSFIEFRN